MSAPGKKKELPLREVVEITVPPSTRARVSFSGGGGRPSGQLTVNLALALALKAEHRVVHRILVRDKKPGREPEIFSPEEKVLRSIFGQSDDSTSELAVIGVGEPVQKGAALVKTVADGDMHFTSAAQGEVESVERFTAGLPKGFVEQIEVTVRWIAPLTAGDGLLAGKKLMGVVTAIVDDGDSQPALTVDGVAGAGDTLQVTRALPTAQQRVSARGIGPYSVVTQRPVTGERISDEELSWLANRGYFALFGDFAAYKGDPPERRTQVFEDLVTGRPISDPWSGWQEGQVEKQRRDSPAAVPPPADPPRDIFSFFEKPGSGDQPPTLRFGYANSLARVAGISLLLEGHSIVARQALPVDSAWSKGEVKKPETINFRTLVPEKGGLFCQQIFGPVNDYECACGTLKRMKYRGEVCPSCGVECCRSSVRRERFGHIELPSPVVPFHLRPLLGALLDADPVAAIDSLPEDGGAELSGRLASIDPRDRSASLLAGDPRRTVLDAFASSGLSATALLWHRIPVLPPDLRPLIPLGGGRIATSDLNDLYRRVLNRSNRLARLLQLNAPAAIIVNERREMQVAVDLLFLNGSMGKNVPDMAVEGRTLLAVVPTLLGVLRGEGARRVDYSGKAVAVVDASLEGDPVVPQEILFEISRPIVYGLAEKAGYVTTIKSAKKLTQENREIRAPLVEEVFRERPLLFAGGNGAMAATRVRPGEEPVIRMGTELAAQLGIQTGEEARVHLPISDVAVEEARRMAGGNLSVVEPVAGSSWIADLPRSPAAAAERLIELALEGARDEAMHPLVALLVGGYEMLKH